MVRRPGSTATATATAATAATAAASASARVAPGTGGAGHPPDVQRAAPRLQLGEAARHLVDGAADDEDANVAEDGEDEGGGELGRVGELAIDVVVPV